MNVKVFELVITTLSIALIANAGQHLTAIWYYHKKHNLKLAMYHAFRDIRLLMLAVSSFSGAMLLMQIMFLLRK